MTRWDTLMWDSLCSIIRVDIKNIQNMNPMEEKGDDEEDDIGGFTEWLTEDSTETSDEVAELIKVTTCIT